MSVSAALIRHQSHSDLSPLQKWPSGDLIEFREIQTSFFLHCKELSLRVLRVLAHSLGLDPDVFLGAHRFIGSMYRGAQSLLSLWRVLLLLWLLCFQLEATKVSLKKFSESRSAEAVTESLFICRRLS